MVDQSDATIHRTVWAIQRRCRAIPDQTFSGTRFSSLSPARPRGARTTEQQAEIDELNRRYQALTAREREVMRLVVAGMLNKQIASEIGTSEATVKIHRGNVLQKMHAGSPIESVRLADKLKLIFSKWCATDTLLLRCPSSSNRLPPEESFTRCPPVSCPVNRCP